MMTPSSEMTRMSLAEALSSRMDRSRWAPLWELRPPPEDCTRPWKRLPMLNSTLKPSKKTRNTTASFQPSADRGRGACTYTGMGGGGGLAPYDGGMALSDMG